MCYEPVLWALSPSGEVCCVEPYCVHGIYHAHKESYSGVHRVGHAVDF